MRVPGPSGRQVEAEHPSHGHVLKGAERRLEPEQLAGLGKDHPRVLYRAAIGELLAEATAGLGLELQVSGGTDQVCWGPTTPRP